VYDITQARSLRRAELFRNLVEEVSGSALPRLAMPCGVPMRRARMPEPDFPPNA
jgi:hypothetical protein